MTFKIQRLILALLLGVSIATANAQSITDLDAKNGFRDVVFGNALSSYPDMKLFNGGQAIKYYKRESDRLFIGEARLSEIKYGFYNGRLVDVTIELADLRSVGPVVKALQASYGPGKEGLMAFSKSWSGRKVQMELNDYKQMSGPVLYIMSRTGIAQMQAETGRNAKGDL